MNNFITSDVQEDIRVRASKRAGFPFTQPDEFAISYSPIKAGIFHIYLFGVIESSEQFIPAIEVLQAASESDVVIIHLSTPGGSLDAADTFIDAMRNCEARVIIKASGGVHSAGTLILLNADEFSLSENCNFLIHNGSTGSGGKFSDWKAEVKHTQKYMETVMRDSYAGFLTEKEIEELLEGKDFWLDGEGFLERWNARNEYFKERIENSQNDALKAILAASEGLASVEEKKPSKKKPKKAVVEVPDEN